MTVIERVNSIVNGQTDLSGEHKTASIEKMIYLAYYMGKEEATRKVSDDYRNLIAEMRKRASECRYKHFANKVIGELDFIYEPEYSKDVTDVFGNDKADI